MPHLVPKSTFPICVEIIIHAPGRYFTLAAPRRAPSLGAVDTLAAVGTGASGLLRGATGPPPLVLRFRPSRKLFQTIRIGLAIKTDEYVPAIIPHTSAKAKPF